MPEPLRRAGGRDSFGLEAGASGIITDFTSEEGIIATKLAFQLADMKRNPNLFLHAKSSQSLSEKRFWGYNWGYVVKIE